MPRFLSERRAWLVAALFALALLAAVFSWGVSRAPDHAARVIEERLGVSAEVEDTALSLNGVELRGLVLRGLHGGFSVRLEAVRADASLLAIPWKGVGAVRGVTARDVTVNVDVSDDGFEDSMTAVRDKLEQRRNSTTTNTARTAQKGRTYVVSDVTARVRDEHGLLIATQDAALSSQPGELRASAVETSVGDRAGDRATIGMTRLALRRAESGWTLHALEVRSASVRSLLDGEDRSKTLAVRIRNAATRLQGASKPVSSDAREPKPPPAGLYPGDRSARLFARLSRDASVSVSEVDIETRIFGTGRVESIEDFGFELEGGNNGWYRIGVVGETSNRGRVLVDLSIHPEHARAEGSLELRTIPLALISPFVPQLPLYESEKGTIGAKLDLVASSTDRVALEGSFRIRELALAHERIAAEPIRHINLDLRGKGAWFPAQRRLAIDDGLIRIDKARLRVEGELERTPEHYRIDLTAKLPPTECNDVVGAVPEDLLRSLSGFSWSGTWSAASRVSLDSRDLEATELSIRVRNLCTFERIPRWVRVERFQEPFRHRVIEPDDTVFQMITGPGTDTWVAASDVSPFMAPAVISHEDGAFYDHGGFAPWAIRDALVRNLEEGRYVVGASTISMQLAKNLYLQRDKTLARKAQEVILTWWLENALTKDEILELYLNVIEYGPSVYGLKQAAGYYFGRLPYELSPAEAAFLACMLPSPKRYHVSYERGALTRSMRSRMRRLLEHMAKRERIGAEALAYGLAELEDFRFHREGDPPPPPRLLPPLGVLETPDPAELDPFEALFMSP